MNLYELYTVRSVQNKNGRICEGVGCVFGLGRSTIETIGFYVLCRLHPMGKDLQIRDPPKYPSPENGQTDPSNDLFLSVF